MTLPDPPARCCPAAAGSLLGGAAVVPAQDDKKDDDKEEKKLDDKEIAKLIDQLGDDDEDKGKAAEEKLLELGEQTHEAVRKAAKDHADADVRLRATLLEKDIARGAFRELHKMTGHEKVVRWIAVSKDGKKALTGSQDGTMRLWDLVNGQGAQEAAPATQSWTLAGRLLLRREAGHLLRRARQDGPAVGSGKGRGAEAVHGLPASASTRRPSRPTTSTSLGGEGGDDDEKASNDIHLFDKETGKRRQEAEGTHRLRLASGLLARQQEDRLGGHERLDLPHLGRREGQGGTTTARTPHDGWVVRRRLHRPTASSC